MNEMNEKLKEFLNSKSKFKIIHTRQHGKKKQTAIQGNLKGENHELICVDEVITLEKIREIK